MLGKGDILMAEVKGVEAANTNICSTAAAHAPAQNNKSIVTQQSIWTEEQKLIEDVAQFLPRNTDGTLDTKKAKEFSILDLLELANAALAAQVEAKTPNEKKQQEIKFRAFDNLLQKREADDMKNNYMHNLQDLHKTIETP